MIANATLIEELDALLDLRQDLLDDPYPLYHGCSARRRS